MRPILRLNLICNSFQDQYVSQDHNTIPIPIHKWFWYFMPKEEPIIYDGQQGLRGFGVTLFDKKNHLMNSPLLPPKVSPSRSAFCLFLRRSCDKNLKTWSFLVLLMHFTLFENQHIHFISATFSVLQGNLKLDLW